MGLNLYCDNCRKFIKEIDHNQAMKLKGSAICTKCQKVAEDTFEGFKKKCDELINEIGAYKSEGIKVLEDMLRKAIKK